MKRAKILFSIASIGALASCNGSEQMPDLRDFNVIYILADDLGYGDVSANNPRAKSRTPHVDALIRSGINFTEAHAGAALSVPSRYGLLTGRHYFRTVNQQKEPYGYLVPQIEKGRTTLASMLKEQGYQTAIVGKYHLGMEWEKRADGSFNHDVDPREGPNSYNNEFKAISLRKSFQKMKEDE